MPGTLLKYITTRYSILEGPLTLSRLFNLLSSPQREITKIPKQKPVPPNLYLSLVGVKNVPENPQISSSKIEEFIGEYEDGKDLTSVIIMDGRSTDILYHELSENPVIPSQGESVSFGVLHQDGSGTNSEDLWIVQSLSYRYIDTSEVPKDIGIRNHRAVTVHVQPE